MRVCRLPPAEFRNRIGGKADIDPRPAEGPLTHLGDVAEAMVKGGTWGRVEMGFFGAVDQYIATGEVSLAAWTASEQRLEINPRGGR